MIVSVHVLHIRVQALLYLPVHQLYAIFRISIENLEKISSKFKFSKDDCEPLVQTCMTTLSSKIVGRCKRSMAEMCVQAVLGVADLERKDVNLELIKVCGTFRQQHLYSSASFLKLLPLSKSNKHFVFLLGWEPISLLGMISFVLCLFHTVVSIKKSLYCFYSTLAKKAKFLGFMLCVSTG